MTAGETCLSANCAGTPPPRRACASRHRRGPTRPRRGELIDTKYGGTITKRYLYELRLAQRRVSRSPIRLAQSAYAQSA